ncbi:MAG TPA: hypothetical protein VIP56_06510 [Nitrososphaeraceae archaeon]|jgi:hypothetical protein
MFKRVGGEISEMIKQKKLFNKKGDSVEIKQDGKDVTVTVQYTTKVEPTVSAPQGNFNDLISVYERTGFIEEPKR